MVHCKHPDCLYRSDKSTCCVYILIEGHPRPCPAGECKGVYTPKDGYYTVFGRRRKTGAEELVSESQLWDKYFDGWSDGKIAAYFGVAVRVVRDWRNTRDLPAVTEFSASEDDE